MIDFTFILRFYDLSLIYFIFATMEGEMYRLSLIHFIFVTMEGEMYRLSNGLLNLNMGDEIFLWGGHEVSEIGFKNCLMTTLSDLLAISIVINNLSLSLTHRSCFYLFFREVDNLSK